MSSILEVVAGTWDNSSGSARALYSLSDRAVRPCSAAGPALSALSVCIRWILTAAPRGGETEAQRGDVTCRRPHSWKAVGL